ncbi:hypothetical protein P3T23_000373 [Paraburkholderia sp. GAS448]|uniref:hypothetical protein n=1 Tax=Paraburkholderia sp. GAS448 TaxID=3035136 RepID=UPI003D1F8FF3
MDNPNTLFEPQHADATGSDEADMVQHALACIDAFTECFNARDLSGMDARLAVRSEISSSTGFP